MKCVNLRAFEVEKLEKLQLARWVSILQKCQNLPLGFQKYELRTESVVSDGASEHQSLMAFDPQCLGVHCPL